MRWVTAFAVAVVVPMLASEFTEWCPWLSKRLIRLAIRRLPNAHRSRYEEEWLAELEEVPGKLAKLVVALGILANAARMSRVLRGHSIPIAVWRFVLAVAIGGAIVVAINLPKAALQLNGWASLWQPLVYAFGLVVGERFTVKVPLRHHRFSVGATDMVIVLGLVFLDPPVLVVATGVGIAVSQLLFERQPVKRLFNVPQYILAVAAAALVSSVLVELIQRSDMFGRQLEPGVFQPALAVVWTAGMATFFVINHSLVSVVTSLSAEHGLAQSWLRAAPVAAADWAPASPTA